jgi:hypothetical protein
MGHGQVVVFDSTDEKIDVELWEIPRKQVGFGAVEIELTFKVTTQLVDSFVIYYRSETAETG